MNEPSDESFIEQVEESAAELSKEIAADTTILANSIGGWRGAIDSGLPSIVFLAIYFAKHHDLQLALKYAVATGVVLAVIALVQRKSLQQVISGLIGLALSAYITSRTGQAQNFFLTGIIRNGIYGLVFLISVWLKRPVLGYLLALLRTTESIKEAANSEEPIEKPDKVLWREDPELLRKYSTVTWVWTLMFLGRFVIMFPMWAVHATGALGVASVVLGYPLFALVGYASYAILREKSEKVSD
ncbi:MAG: DUF3159 domain-containing protein [Actinobacteria bacterium]|nr:DUF3159 domain-containing protein [Actinomycetota bacterium]